MSLSMMPTRPRARERETLRSRIRICLWSGDAGSGRRSILQGRFRLPATSQWQSTPKKAAANRRDSERPGPRRAGALGWNAGPATEHMELFSVALPAFDAASLCFSVPPMLPGARITSYACMQLVPSHVAARHKLSLLATTEHPRPCMHKRLSLFSLRMVISTRIQPCPIHHLGYF
ncbi:hypothetical protein ACQKWADRAFT_292024 [Trichoderma austrokoningii]